MRILKYCIHVALCFGFYTTSAQANPDLLTQGEKFFKPFGQTTLDRSSNPSGEFVEFDIQPDAQSAKISLSRSYSKGNEGNKSRFSIWSFEASTPIDEDEGLGSLINFDGLSNVNSLSLKWSNARVSGLRKLTRESALRGVQICEELGLSVDPINGDCDADTVATAASEADKPQLLSMYDALFWDTNASRLLYGGELKIGDKSFSVVNPDTFDAVNVSENPWSVELFASWAPLNGTFLFSTGLSYERTYKPEDEETRCQDSTEMDDLVCETGSFGPPKKNINELIFIEARRKFFGTAASLKITHDFEDDVTRLDLPIYLLSNSDNKLTGGIRFGWDDDEEDVSVGLFVGSAFDLFKN